MSYICAPKAIDTVMDVFDARLAPVMEGAQRSALFSADSTSRYRIVLHTQGIQQP